MVYELPTDSGSSSSSSSRSNSSCDYGSNSENYKDIKRQDVAEPPSTGSPRLQSARLVPLQFTQDIAKSLTKKMSLLLNELGMPENPLPTKAVCDLVDVVRKETATLLSIQNALHKREGEVASQKTEATTQIKDANLAIANHNAANNGSSSGNNGAKIISKNFEMPLLMTTSDTEIVIPQSMLTNSEYVAAPAPPISTVVENISTKKSSSNTKRKAADSPDNEVAATAIGTSSSGGAQVKVTSQPAAKKSKKSS